MSRDRVVDGGVAALLAALALAIALPFRAEALAKTPLVSLGWDAALHAAEGLDLFDDLRLGRPFDAFSLLVSRHWWGPAWALVSAPFQAAFGPSLAAASLPSLAAFALAPAMAFLLARRLSPAGGPASAALTGLVVAGLFLRSPMLLEISAWPMLEGLGGLVALAVFYFFARREERLSRRTAFLAGAFLFLLKYHFGFFVLATLGGAVLREESPESRSRLAAAARSLFARGAGLAVFALALLLSIARFTLEARGGDALARRVPSVSNVAWGTFVLFVLLFALRRRSFVEAWAGASGTFRDLVLFGFLPCASWCLDPANVRGWYRQVLPASEAAERNPLAKLSAFWGFLREDYTVGAGAAALVALGLVLAVALPRNGTRRALAAFAIWPVLLMSLSAYPVEPRFLGCLAPCLFAAAVAGLGAGASRLGEWPREAALAAAVVILVLNRGDARWRATLAARAPYRFSYGAAGTAAVESAVEAALAAAPAGGPVRLRLPGDPPVWPTVRLALRLGRRDLAPSDVDVEGAAGS